MPATNENQVDEDRPRKKKPLAGPLLAATWIAIAWAGASVAYFGYRLALVIELLLSLEDNVELRPRELEFTRGAVITLVVLYALLLLTALFTLSGGIAVLRRRATGAYFVIGGAGTAGFVSLVGSVTLVIFTRGSRGFLLYLFGFFLTTVLSIAACVYNSFVHYDKKNTKRLK